MYETNRLHGGKKMVVVTVEKLKTIKQQSREWLYQEFNRALTDSDIREIQESGQDYTVVLEEIVKEAMTKNFNPSNPISQKLVERDAFTVVVECIGIAAGNIDENLADSERFFQLVDDLFSCETDEDYRSMVDLFRCFDG